MLKGFFVLLPTVIIVLIVLHYGLAQQLTVQPQSVVQAEGLEAVFECLCPEAVFHIWAINGIFPSDSEFPPNFTQHRPVGDIPAKLIIPAISAYNSTVVQCEALFREGGECGQSENTTLKVQEPLQRVSNFHFNMDLSTSTIITISWDPPFSLNLTTAEPDIQYCVDVCNVTGGGDDHLQSVCDITDTYYTFTASDPDQLFNFTVTPRSNVEGSLNGTTSQPVQGFLLQDPIGIPPEMFELVADRNSGHFEFDVIFPFKALGSYPGSFPTEYKIELADTTSKKSLFNCSTLQRNKNDVIELEAICTDDIEHQLFDMTLRAINRVGESVSGPIPLSTHDVQKVYISGVEAVEQLVVSCLFLNGSTDPGYLVIAWSGSEILYGAAAVNSTDLELRTVLTLQGIMPHESYVVVYDLQSKGLPEKTPAAIRTITNASSAVTDFSYSEPLLSLLHLNSSVTSENGMICLSCSFSADELTGCVGVIHSAQLDNLTLTVLSVERSGGVNCTVDELMEGNYSVAVFGRLPGNFLEQEPAFVKRIVSTQEFIVLSEEPSDDISANTVTVALATAVIAGVFLLLIVVAVTLLIVNNINKQKRVFNTQPSHTMEPLPRYEDLPFNKPDPGYENVMLTDLNRVDVPDMCQQEPAYNEPAYDVAISVPEIQSAPIESDATHQHSEVNYALVSTKSNTSNQPSEDPTKVKYATLDYEKLVPTNGESEEQTMNLADKPEPSPLLTAETIFSELHPIADKWEELGEALGVPEHILDNISTEGSDQVRLHEMVHYYFSSTQFTHTWEEIVRALREIGETEAADRIVRTGKARAEPHYPLSAPTSERSHQNEDDGRNCFDDIGCAVGQLGDLYQPFIGDFSSRDISLWPSPITIESETSEQTELDPLPPRSCLALRSYKDIAVCDKTMNIVHTSAPWKSDYKEPILKSEVLAQDKFHSMPLTEMPTGSPHEHSQSTASMEESSMPEVTGVTDVSSNQQLFDDYNVFSQETFINSYVQENDGGMCNILLNNFREDKNHFKGAEVINKLNSKYNKEFKSTWYSLIVAVAFEENQRSYITQTPCKVPMKPESDLVVCSNSSEENALDALVYTSSEKVEKADKTPCIISSVVRFTEDIEPTSNPDPTSASDTSTPVKVSARPNLRDHEENLHTKRACPRIGKVCYSRKASRGQKQQRMWKFSVLPSATQELSRRVSNPNSEEIFAALILQTKRIASDGWWDSKLQLPKHGLLFQPH